MRAFTCLVGLTLLLAPPADAQIATDSVTLLRATGSADYRVTADGAEFYLILEGRGNTAAQATAPCRNVTDSVRRVLEPFIRRGVTYEVAEGSVMTPAPSPYGRDPGPERFTARTLIHVRLTDLSMLAPLTAAALDAGASRIGGMRYSARAVTDARRAALDAALADAKAGAERTALRLGGRLGRIQEIENPTDYPSSETYLQPVQDLDQPTRGLPEIRGRMNIIVVWRFLPHGA